MGYRKYEEIDKKVFSRNLKKLRKSLPNKPIQGEIAKELGVSRGAYADWETQVKYLPNHDVMVRLIRTYGYSYEQLLFSDDMISEGPINQKSGNSSQLQSRIDELEKQNSMLTETINVYYESHQKLKNDLKICQNKK